MKILKIEFQNINSLKGSHEIDFSSAPFTASSLFAITGPTGSGKSTILDVISLALFNQVPRLGKISKSEILNKGAILTRNQKEAWARITYESKSGVFASHWSISTNRNDKLRDYEMQIFDLSTEKALDLRKSDVPAKNEELIGLNYDQFIKSVLLAQGEFAQFLRAKKDERGELLEKITGTGIYRQLGIKAFQKKKEVSSEIEKEQQEIELHQKSLLEEDVQKALSKELSQKSQNCEPLEAEVKKLEQNIQLKKDIREQVSELEKVLRKKEVAKQSFEEFEKQHGLILQKHEKIQLFGEELRNWQQLKTEIKGLENDISTINKRLGETEGNITGCLDRIRSFIKNEVQPESIERELQGFSVKVRKLQHQRDEKRSSYVNLQKEFNTEVREIPFQLNGDLDSSENKLLELQGVIQEELEKLTPELSEIDLQDPFSEKQRLRKQLEQARKAEQRSEKIQNTFNELTKLQNEKSEIQPLLEKLPKELELAESNTATFKEKLEKLQLKKENENLRKSMEEHRVYLEAGQPCPLCGALDHPYAEDLPAQEDGLLEEIRQTEKLHAQKQQEMAGLQTSLNHYHRQYANLEKVEKAKTTELEVQKRAFREEFGKLYETEETNWSTLTSQYDRQITALEKYELENRKLKAVSAGLPLIKDLRKVLLEGKEIKEQLDQLYTGTDIDTDCRELQNSWVGFLHQRTALQNQKKDLEQRNISKIQHLHKLEEGLSPKVEKEGLNDILEALERLLPEHRAAELRKKKETLFQETARIESVEKTLRSQLQKLKQSEPESTEEELTGDLNVKRQTLKNWREECEGLRRKLLNDEDIRKRIAKIEAGLAEKKQHIRRWELLNQLIGDSTGKKFNDFAQDLSLSQLLKLANVRLKDLSDRYRIDKPIGEEDDSLVAIDEHMGGQRRSVKTLSGGETFILSLSMALALSDLASKNVEINSLFIDEGFGTLDPETLDQTLDTLEKLQAESSKTIGIISHVDSLKERIATQVKLKRNGQGYSSLEVTG